MAKAHKSHTHQYLSNPYSRVLDRQQVSHNRVLQPVTEYIGEERGIHIDARTREMELDSRIAQPPSRLLGGWAVRNLSSAAGRRSLREIARMRLRGGVKVALRLYALIAATKIHYRGGALVPLRVQTHHAIM